MKDKKTEQGKSKVWHLIACNRSQTRHQKWSAVSKVAADRHELMTHWHCVNYALWQKIGGILIWLAVYCIFWHLPLGWPSMQAQQLSNHLLLNS